VRSAHHNITVFSLEILLHASVYVLCREIFKRLPLGTAYPAKQTVQKGEMSVSLGWDCHTFHNTIRIEYSAVEGRYRPDAVPRKPC